MKPPIDYELLKDQGPCPRCLRLALQMKMDRECVQPLPPDPWAPLGFNGEKCCFDCGDADSLTNKIKALDFEMARVAIGNERREQLRAPGIPSGLSAECHMRPNQGNAFSDHRSWMESVGLA